MVGESVSACLKDGTWSRSVLNLLLLLLIIIIIFIIIIIIIILIIIIRAGRARKGEGWSVQMTLLSGRLMAVIIR